MPQLAYSLLFNSYGHVCLPANAALIMFLFSIQLIKVYGCSLFDTYDLIPGLSGFSRGFSSVGKGNPSTRNGDKCEFVFLKILNDSVEGFFPGLNIFALSLLQVMNIS